MRVLSVALLVAVAGSAATTAHAGLIFFTDQPSSNSVNWSNSVLAAGGVINSNVNFETHPTGALQTDFYSVSDGVTFSSHFNFDQVRFSVGPGQGGLSGALPGEGTHPRSNYLHVEADGVFTVSFATPVIGAGFFTIDKFDMSFLRLKAFSEPQAGGTLLGEVLATSQNFQRNNLFFMGVQSDDPAGIGSIQLVFDAGGDVIGLDDFVFATAPPPSPPQPAAAPEPASIMLLGMGAIGLAGVRRRRMTAAERPA